MATKIPAGLTKQYLYLISFVEGFSVMALEISSSRMIAPFFGSSLFVWTSVLGVSLIALTAGYFAGGSLAAKKRTENLFFILFLAFVFSALMPLIGHSVMASFLDNEILTATIISSIFFLFPPLFLLGMVPPMIIQLFSEKEVSASRSTGIVFSISTIGGILASFITGFLLIPSFGLRITVFFASIVLLLIPLIHYLKKSTSVQKTAVLGIAFICMVAQIKAFSKKLPASAYYKIQFREDGLLGQLMVIDDIKSSTRTLFVNNISQSFMHIPTGRSQWQYIHRLSLYSSVKPAGSSVLVAGLGAGNLVNELVRVGLKVDVCDIDKRTAYVSEKYFFRSPETQVYIDDARHFIEASKKKYDIVILDMSLGENQPTNVYTLESFKKIKDLLNPEGFVFLHYQNALSGEGKIAVASIGKTLQEAGFVTKMLNTAPRADQPSELMFFASQVDIDLAKADYSRRDTFAIPFKFPTTENIFLTGVDFKEGEILIDDKPRMEELHEKMIVYFRKQAIELTSKQLLHEGIQLY